MRGELKQRSHLLCNSVILTGAGGSDWKERIVATHPPLLFTGSPAFVLYLIETSSPVSLTCSCITSVF